MKKVLLILLLIALRFTSFAQYETTLHPLEIEWQNISVLSQVKGCEDCNVPFAKPFTVFPINRLEFNNFQIGPTLMINDDSARVGFEIMLPLKKSSYVQFMVVDEYNNVDKDKRIKHRFLSISPTVDLKYKLGKFNNQESWMTAILGLTYDFNFSYNRTGGNYGAFVDYFKYPESVDRNSDNMTSGGFHFRIGFGMDYYSDRNRDKKEKLYSIKLLYQHMLYNPFNTDYTFEGKKIYKDWTTKFGHIGFKITRPLLRKKPSEEERKLEEETNKENNTENIVSTKEDSNNKKTNTIKKASKANKKARKKQITQKKDQDEKN